MKKLIRFSRWVGEFPQCLLGFILTKIYDVKYKETYNDIYVYEGNFPGGISLGLYILVHENASDNTKKHEYGHTRQSLQGGGLYLPVVGITSGVGCILHNMDLVEKDYYSVGPENEADELGNVNRK